MTFKEIIWPWGALLKVKRAQAYDSNTIQTMRAQLGQQRAQIGLLQADVVAKRRLIEQGHFRNPKTGRLGRKGETFLPNAARD